jgi:hypothetical protein
MNRHGTRGFTLVEVAAVVATVGVLGGLVAISADPPPRGLQGGGGFLEALAASRQSARQLKDATQLRAIHQGMVMWAQNNNDEYPLPSRIDRANHTTADEGRAKDTTANIFSIMVFSGLITTETLISPLEKNRSVRNYRDYAYDSPRGAVNARLAHWDPKMQAGLSKDSRGHISYAHLQPAAGRLAKWSNTFVATDYVLSNRGPEMQAVEQNEDGTVTVRLANTDSLTLRFAGAEDTWDGHIVGSDNHVEFASSRYADGRQLPAPRAQDGMPRYKAKDGKAWRDVLFFDEADDPETSNLFLGMFTKAGEKPADFNAIWD